MQEDIFKVFMDNQEVGQTKNYEDNDDGYQKLIDGFDQFLQGKTKGGDGQASTLALPRKPLNPQHRFLLENERIVRSQNNTWTNNQIQQYLINQWKNLDELKKAQYYQAYEYDNQQYEILLGEYNELCKPPKKYTSAYNIYFTNESKRVRQEYPQILFNQISHELSLKWKSMDKEQRNIYEVQAHQNKLIYEQKYNEFQLRKVLNLFLNFRLFFKKNQNDQYLIGRYQKNKKIYEDMLKQTKVQHREVAKEDQKQQEKQKIKQLDLNEKKVMQIKQEQLNIPTRTTRSQALQQLIKQEEVHSNIRMRPNYNQKKYQPQKQQQARKQDKPQKLKQIIQIKKHKNKNQPKLKKIYKRRFIT